MSLDVLIGIIGVLVTLLVVAGMILITPRGAVPHRAHAEPRERERDATPAAEPLECAVR
jgi:uncharacterized iron-regulated membrane protein